MVVHELLSEHGRLMLRVWRFCCPCCHKASQTSCARGHLAAMAISRLHQSVHACVLRRACIDTAHMLALMSSSFCFKC